MRILFLFLLLLTASPFKAAIGANRLLEAKCIATIQAAELDSLRKSRHIPHRLAPVQFAVSVYDVLYTTAWSDGSPVVASGFVLVPVDAKGGMPLLSYNHGTRLQKAREWSIAGEEVICAYYASDGYIVAIPDYVGLRRGERSHLYHHSATEALATVDLLRATRELLSQEHKTWNGQLFLTGYSQGGHAALATHKYIEERLKGEFTVTASAPMSGAYDLAGVQGRVLNAQYAQPGYLPYLVYTYQAVYHLLPDSADYFQAPYDTLLPRLYSGQYSFRDINPMLPNVPAEMLKPGLLKAFAEDPNHPLRMVMIENSLVDWAPVAPVLLCYCKSDEQVNYENSLVAYDKMKALGSEMVEKRMAGRKFNHGPCSIFTSIYARMWFDSFRQGSTTGKKGPAWNRFLVQLSKLVIPKK